ncbi:MAG: N-acetylmuramoyl-L-alanine amidase [Ardenticatenaceae bacterium]|nr:N-acetylmuramoyl-L-alanine amidase [Ardenticatenaceae bacterium]
MKRRTWIDFGLLAALILLAALVVSRPQLLATSEAAASAFNSGGMETVVYHNLTLQSDGWTYISDPIDAPISFNAVVPEWRTAVVNEEISFEMRTGKNGVWEAWTPVLHSHDLLQEGDVHDIGDMLVVPAVDRTHNQVQLRAYTSLALAELRLTYIDTSEGPTVEEMVATQALLDAQQGYDTQATSANPKPTVISREVWCTDSGCACPPGGCGNSCLDSDPLVYQSVSHLVVHHTVSSNSSADWAAVMRAIWRFHALSGGRCWGDIGYNYLIDMNGVIYEGHRGGDDVVGTHAAGANKGSMGVSLIGTFTWPEEYSVGIAPPQSMRNSLVDLLAWKADQKNIDVYGAGYLPELYGGRTRLMGHRDVYGTTTCPGGQAHAMLPEIRDQVAQRLSWLDTSWYYIDELDSRVTRSNSNWRTPTYQCGYNAHSTYTWSTSDQNASPYWHEYRFDVPSNGVYELQVFVPYCNTGQDETNSANYTVYHANGSDTFTVNQEARVGLWTSLGQFELSVNSNHRLYLDDITNDDGNGVWFDDIRLRPVTVTTGNITLVAPGNSTNSNNREVTFTWETEAVSNSTGLRFEAATDQGMNNIVYSQTLDGGTTSLTHTFGEDYQALYWRVIVTGNPEIYSPVRQILIDATAPTIGASSVYEMPGGYYLIDNADISDALSGIDTIELNYREVGNSVWISAGTNGNSTAFAFNAPNPSKSYEFRYIATDQVGNTATSAVDATTDQAIALQAAAFAAVVFR